MREEAEQLEAAQSEARTLVPELQRSQDDLRSHLATLDPNSPEYVSGNIDLSQRCPAGCCPCPHVDCKWARTHGLLHHIKLLMS